MSTNISTVAPDQVDRVDVRGPRFAAWVTTAVIVAALAVSAFSNVGAAVILEGSVRREGNRVRVTAQLINAKNDHHLWAETYDRDLTDVFSIQSAVAQEIVTALRAHLSPQEKERIERKPTENSQAYDFYLQARDYYSRPGNLAENFSNAERLCEEAVGLDPAFALAYAQLSRIHSVMYWFAHDRSPERLARAESAKAKGSA